MTVLLSTLISTGVPYHHKRIKIQTISRFAEVNSKSNSLYFIVNHLLTKISPVMPSVRIESGSGIYTP